MSPKVSIITVNLNDREGLLKTIKSVVSQTYSDKEYIIVDGGSRDGSLEVIQKFESQINRWVSESDNGIYDAMNKGIKMTDGDWIIFMNSGDSFIDEKVIDRVFFNRSSNSGDIIHGNIVYKDSGRILQTPSRVNKRFFYNDTLCHQSIFTNRKVFQNLGEYSMEYLLIADREWLLRALKSGMIFIPVNVNICEWDPSGVCISNPRKYYAEINHLRQTHFSLAERFLFFLLKKGNNFLKRITS